MTMMKVKHTKVSGHLPSLLLKLDCYIDVNQDLIHFYKTKKQRSHDLNIAW